MPPRTILKGNQMTILIILTLLIALVLAGFPIAFTMLALSSGYFLLGPTPNLVAMLPWKIFEGIDHIVLSAVPFFLLSGEIMTRSGIADRLMDFANELVGRVRGGLAHVNVVVSMLFSGLTGVAVGDIAALGRIEVQSMERAGYPRAFASAVTVSSALIGPIIPPSGLIILYCAIMDISVGGMFVAAIIPGILMGLGDMLLIASMSKRRNFPKVDYPFSIAKVASKGRHALLALAMPFIIIGGIVGGIVTPTEASAVAVIYAIVVGLIIYRSISPGEIWQSFSNASYESARLLFMIGAALSMSWVFALEDLPGQFAQLFAYLDGSLLLVLICINILFIVAGVFMEPSLAIILFGPVVAPVAMQAGVHPLQLGVMLLVNVTVGLATPPVGNALFAMAGVVNVDVGKLIKELLPFLFIKFLIMLLIGAVPWVTLAIPGLMGLK